MTHGPNPEKITAFLEGCVVQMVASREWFARRVLLLSPDQLRWRPGLSAWSIGDCLDHLNRTLAYYLPLIERAIDQSPRNRSARERIFPQSEKAFLLQIEPPVRRKRSAAPQLRPVSAVDPDRLVDQFPQLREKYVQAVHSAARVDLANVTVENSIHPPVRSLGGIMAMLAAHDRRHLWQAERVRNAAGFPACPTAPSPAGER
jgi:hypothetical protein